MAVQQTNKENYRYEQGYADGRSSSSGSNTLLSFLVGLLIAAILGGAAWFAFGQVNRSSGGDTDVINVPAPEAPEAPEAPDVNINVPKPELEVPKIEVPSGEGDSSSGSQE